MGRWSLAAFFLVGLIPLWSQDLPAGPSIAALDAQWDARWAQGPAVGTDSQGLTTYLLEGELAHSRPDRLVQVVGWLESLRQNHPQEPGYQNLFWYWGDTQIRDTNGVEFLNRDAVLAWVLCRNQLTPELRAAHEAFLRGNLEGIRRHKVDLDYTNITLMKAWNLLALGESLPDDRAFREGKDLLGRWLDRVRHHGVREFLSPTYTEVDLENLGLIRRYITDPTVQQGAQEGLDYQWALVIAHNFEPAHRLGGTHSRDYDRLTGHGALDSWMARLSQPADLGSVRSNLAWAGPSYSPLTFQATSGQTVGVRWDDHAWATWYRGTHWGLGSASQNYYDMDKTPFVLDLASDPRTPVVNFWMDGRGDYDGFGLTLEGSGHWKSLHLKPQLAAAQRAAEVLFVAADDGEGLGRVDSTISLPAEARYWLNGQELHPFFHESRWTLDPAPLAPLTSVTVEGTLDHPVLVIRDQDPQRGVGVQQTMPVVPGEVDRTTIRGVGDLNLYHNYYDAQGHLIGGEQIRSVHRVTEGPATQVTTAPEGAVTLKVWLYSSIRAVGEFSLTDVRVDRGPGSPAPTMSFDWEPRQPFAQTVRVGDVLAIRLGSAGAVLRPVVVQDSDGKAVSLELSNDPGEHRAFRLTAHQGGGGPGHRAVTAFYVRASDVDDSSWDSFVQASAGVAFRASASADTWSVQADGVGGALAITLNPVQKTRTLVPNPEDWGPGTFWVDGHERGAALLGPATSP